MRIPLGRRLGTIATLTERSDQVRQRILDGAARAFARSGPRATSVPEIASESGVSVGLIYRYFKGKAELYAATCFQRAGTEIAALRAEMASIQDPQRRLEHALDFYLARLASDGEAALIIGAMAESHGSPGIGAALELRRDTMRQFIVEYLEERVAARELEPPVEPLAHAISLTLDGALAEIVVGGVELRDTRAAILALLRRVIQVGSGPAPTTASA